MLALKQKQKVMNKNIAISQIAIHHCATRDGHHAVNAVQLRFCLLGQCWLTVSKWVRVTHCWAIVIDPLLGQSWSIGGPLLYQRWSRCGITTVVQRWAPSVIFATTRPMLGQQTKSWWGAGTAIGSTSGSMLARSIALCYHKSSVLRPSMPSG